MEYELYHHGILGMKWGIRRYQNKDGSLTAAGKKRYAENSETSINKKRPRSREKFYTNDGKGIKQIDFFRDTYVPTTQYSNIGGYYSGHVTDCVINDLPDELKKLFESLDKDWDKYEDLNHALFNATDYPITIKNILWSTAVIDYCERHSDYNKIPGMSNALEKSVALRQILFDKEDEIINGVKTYYEIYGLIKD